MAVLTREGGGGSLVEWRCRDTHLHIAIGRILGDGYLAAIKGVVPKVGVGHHTLALRRESIWYVEV